MQLTWTLFVRVTSSFRIIHTHFSLFPENSWLTHGQTTNKNKCILLPYFYSYPWKQNKRVFQKSFGVLNTIWSIIAVIDKKCDIPTCAVHRTSLHVSSFSFTSLTGEVYFPIWGWEKRRLRAYQKLAPDHSVNALELLPHRSKVKLTQSAFFWTENKSSYFLCFLLPKLQISL